MNECTCTPRQTFCRSCRETHVQKYVGIIDNLTADEEEKHLLQKVPVCLRPFHFPFQTLDSFMGVLFLAWREILDQLMESSVTSLQIPYLLLQCGAPRAQLIQLALKATHFFSVHLHSYLLAPDGFLSLLV